MATAKIKPRRSALPNTPPTTANIEQYEIAMNTADKKLYTRDGSDNIITIGAGNLSGLGDVAITSPTNGQNLTYNTSTGKWQNSTAAGAGDVSGPASSTDNALVRFDGTTGKLIQNSTATLSDTGALDVANVTSDYVQLDTTAGAASAVGRITWDAGEGTAVVGLTGGNVNLPIGRSNTVIVYNGSGATIAKGAVVAVAGAQGQRPSVVLADADSEPLSAATLGVAAEAIANGAEGIITTFGIVSGVDTSAFTAGNHIYLSQTAGGLTATRPSAPAHTVFIGWVLHVNASSGRIFININNGWELDELHNVNISSVANNNLLQYDSTNAYWKNVAPSAVTGVGSANQLVTGRTISLTGDVTYTSGSFDGTANVTGTATLANSGVTAGTYQSVTVDAKGRVTAGTNPTTLSGFGITDAQPLDADLTAIAALAGTSGFLKKTAADTWTLDTSTYLTSYTETDTLATVTGRGATTATAVSFTNSTASSSTSNGAVVVTGGVGIGGALNVGGNLTVTGNLTINGTTTTVNSTTVTVDDPIFTLGGDTTPSSNDNKDRGIEFRWHNGTAAKVGFFGFDTSTGYLTFIPDATNTSEVFSGTAGDIQATNFRGALVGNADTATKLATARTINGVSFDGSANITVTTAGTGISVSGTTVTNTGVLSVNGNTGTITGIANASDTHYIGTTAVTLNRASANLALTGISSVTLPGSTSGSVQIVPTAAAGSGTVLTLPATTGTVVTTGDTGTVTNTMLAGSIATSKITGLAASATTDTTNAANISSGTLPLARLSGITTTQLSGTAGITNAQLANSSITVNGTAISLGGSATIKASTTNVLTIGTGLGGVSFDGGSAVTITNTGVTSAVAGTDTSVSSATGAVTINNTSTLATVTGRGATTATAISLTNSTASSSTSTGALVVTGGVGIGGAVNVGGAIAVTGNITINGVFRDATSGGTVISDQNVAQTTVATTAATAIDTWAIATYRSAKYVVQITQGTNYQVSEILVLHNGTTTTMTEYAVLETNGTLATITSDISSTNARLLVTMGSATSATINIQRVLMVV